MEDQGTELEIARRLFDDSKARAQIVKQEASLAACHLGAILSRSDSTLALNAYHDALDIWPENEQAKEAKRIILKRVGQ